MNHNKQQTNVSRLWQLTAAVAAGLLLTSCDSGPELGRVKGTVRFDGEPVANATVIFQPNSGPASHGETNSEGHFELMFSRDKPGAVLGQHSVTIGTYTAHLNQPETLPAKYNTESDLTREVKAGAQTLDFDLTSE